MDVVINSNIQSPLVRTLARTQGKSESFTQHLKDNVPPVSFSKIELAPEGGSTAKYDNVYKFKVPQYGYLRDMVLRFSNTELPLDETIFSTIDTALTALGNEYKELMGVERATTGSTTAPANKAWMWHGLVPHDEYNASDANRDPWAEMWVRYAGGETMNGATAAYETTTALGKAKIIPFRYRCRDNMVHANASNYLPDEISNLQREGPIYPVSGGVPAVQPTENSNEQIHKRNSQGARITSTWDWCSQANLSKHLGALFPEYITLTTHNRPIQTIYPLESLARIYRMPWDLKKKYLSMIRPHITAAGGTSSTIRTPTSLTSTNRSWTCYFPCFFSFFEDTSMNLDTRFVENLEVDVKIRRQRDIYFSYDFKGSSVDNGQVTDLTNGGAITGTGLYEIAAYRPQNDYASAMYDTLQFVPTNQHNIGDSFTLEAIAYFHNFHDTTSQAIRDANYKPNVPANLLTYNTYAENPVNLSKELVAGGGTVNVNLSCNNLVFGITFMVRRRELADDNTRFIPFVDRSQTLPIKSVTLTGSGQQLYKATGAELMMVDNWDHPLSSMKSGTACTSIAGLYADNHSSFYTQSKERGESMFVYHIPFGFSQDMTYNSGALAMQTINNPVLTVELMEIDGIVLNDENVAWELAPFFNKGTIQSFRTDYNDAYVDNEFEIAVFENFWQMTRIDSNTGSITKSLDL